MGAPELVAHDRHRRCAFARVVVLQQASLRWPETQRPKCIRRHGGALDADGLSAAQICRLESAVPGQRLQRPLAAPQVQEVAQRDVGLGETRLHLAVAEHHEVIGPFKRQGPQQHGLDDGKKRRVRADAQREGDDGGGRKGRLAPEDPKRLAEIAHLHGCVRRCDRRGCCAPGRTGTGEVATDKDWGREPRLELIGAKRTRAGVSKRRVPVAVHARYRRRRACI